MGRVALTLLDSVSLVWFSLGNQRLGPRARARIEGETRLLISAITPWEVAMLISKKRIDLGQPVEEWMAIILADTRVRLAPIEPGLAIRAGLMPRSIHGDPADRLIMATALEYGCAVLTPDEKILAYAEAGHVSAVDARL